MHGEIVGGKKKGFVVFIWFGDGGEQHDTHESAV